MLIELAYLGYLVATLLWSDLSDPYFRYGTPIINRIVGDILTACGDWMYGNFVIDRFAMLFIIPTIVGALVVVSMHVASRISERKQ